MPAKVERHDWFAQRFELLTALGEGGYGQVFRAHDHAHDRVVALKFLREPHADSLTRFKREFRALSDFAHPNLVRLEELVEANGKWALIMELVEGVELGAYVSTDRGPTLFDEQRLRDAFAQLAEALSYLHRSGLVHRDVKPSNVRVTPQGRVVLLDFGLVAHLGSTARASTQGGMGTVAYMAPEQADPGPVGPASDWYALGVMLYELLTGQLPYDGSPLHILMNKQKQRPAPPSSIVPGLPPDLDGLVTALVAPDKTVRAGEAQVFAVLKPQTEEPVSGVITRGTQTNDLPFVGRKKELAKLAELFTQARQRVSRLVVIEGESGVGKTALVREFAHSIPDAVVLRGRCYERETATYKAFDGLVESLVSRLRRLPDEEVARLLPRRAGILGRLFPSLERLPAFQRMAGRESIRDSFVARRQAVTALSELFGRMSEFAPLILAIEDLQWSDAESLAAIRALIEPDAQARMLLIATCRPLDSASKASSEGIERLLAMSTASQIKLGGLSPEDALSVSELALRGDGLAASADQIARESGGHPLFIAELVAHARGAGSLSGTLSLDAVVRERMASLTVTARELLELIAVAVRPNRPLLTQALGKSREITERALFELTQSMLARTSSGEDVTCAHDRIRSVVQSAMTEERKALRHRALALSLAQSQRRDPQELAHHLIAAGEPLRAIPPLLEAAERATEALAFPQAVEMLELALEHAQKGAETREVNAIRVKYANALIGCGKGKEGARELLLVAQTSGPDEGRSLKRMAAEQLLRTGELSQGSKLAWELMNDAGISNGLAGKLGMAWDSLATRSKWGSLVLREESEITAHDRGDLDFMAAMLGPMSWVDPLGSFSLRARYAKRALKAGDKLHVTRALGDEISRRLGTFGLTDEVKALVQKHEELAKSLGPRYEAEAHLARATWYWMRLRVREAAQSAQRAEELLTQADRGRDWERSRARAMLLGAWLYLGDLGETTRWANDWLREARDRGDCYEQTHLAVTGGGALRHVIAGKPERATSEVDECTAPWPKTPLRTPHAMELVLRCTIDLYTRPAQALQELEPGLKAFEHSPLYRVPHLRARVLEQTVRSLLARAALLKPEERAPLVKAASQKLGLLQKTRSPGATTPWLDLNGQLALITGQPDLARTHLTKALEIYEQHGQGIGALPLQYLLGRIIDGAEGRAMTQQAVERARACGVVAPRRYFGCYAVVLPLFESGTASGVVHLSP